MTRKLRLRTVLTLLVLATTLPLAAFGAWVVRSSWEQRQALIDRQNIELARGVLVAVDEEIGRTIAALGVLSLVEPIETADKGPFMAIAARTLSLHPGWLSIRLVTPQMTIAGDTEREPGAATLIKPDWAATVFRTGLPAVSGVREDPVSKRWFVTIGVPVMRRDQVIYALGVRVLASAFSDMLRRQSPPQGGLITLLDSTPLVIARTRNEERFVGQPPTKDFIERNRSASEGTWRTVTLEGIPAYSSWSRSELTGWIVANAMPAETVEGPVRSSLMALVFTGLVTLGAAVALAMYLGRDLVRSAVSLEREQAARRNAEALNLAKDEFVATVSHELRTPLNAILGWVSLLRAGALPAERSEHALEVIERNTRLQSQLIEDLLDMSRMLRGNVQLELQDVDLRGMLEAVLDSARPMLAGRQIQLGAALPADPVVVSGDRHRLQQIFWNLLANALKFTPPGGRVDVSLALDGREAVVRVSDTGEGIAPEFMPYLFDRFRQETADTTRIHSGLGIGLSLARDLAELHGGGVSAESPGKGQGSTFIVRLPVSDATYVRL